MRSGEELAAEMADKLGVALRFYVKTIESLSKENAALAVQASEWKLAVNYYQENGLPEIENLQDRIKELKESHKEEVKKLNAKIYSLNAKVKYLKNEIEEF